MALARFVTPEEFGVVAAAMAAIGLLTVLADAGFAAALIQAPEVPEGTASTVFWAQVGIAASLAAAVAGPALLGSSGAPQQAALRIAASLAPSLVLNATTGVPLALWARELAFRPPAVALLVASGSGAAAALAAAVAGMGLWALVLQQLVTAAVFAGLILALSSFRPRLGFDGKALTRLARFGSPLLAASLIDAAATRAYVLLVRGAHGARDLGHYWSAYQLYLVPQVLLANGAGKFAFAYFAQGAGGGSEPGDVRRLLRAVHVASLPWIVVLSFLAEPLVALAFGPGWREAAAVFRILAWALLATPAAVVNLSWLKAAGRSGDFLRAEVSKKTVLIVLVAAASSRGPLAVAWAMVGAAGFAFVVNAWYSRSAHGRSVLGQALDLVAPLFCAVAVGACAWLAYHRVVGVGTAPALAAAAAAAAVTQLLVARLLVPAAVRDVTAFFRRNGGAAPFP
jgi:O-antigen/teichoic acid export membrane protein